MFRLILPALVLALPVSAQAATIDKSKLLWGTVNICDSPQSPDTFGVRASMPGSGKKGERMWMKFKVQYKSATDGLWHNFASADGTDSDFVPVGAAKYKARQSGWTFPFTLDPGQQYELRGVVNFEWRKGTKVVRKAVKQTSSGHRTSVAEPSRYSAATCVLKG
jgi:hypothetical protein